MRRRRRHDDLGSALILMPAGVLVVLVLAAIAVDLSLVQLRKRQAFDLATAAANDAVVAGADQERLRDDQYRLDPDRTATAVARTIGAGDVDGDATWSYRITVDGIEVTVALPADYIFADVVPGAPDGTVVEATASAVAPRR